MGAPLHNPALFENHYKVCPFACLEAVRHENRGTNEIAPKRSMPVRVAAKRMVRLCMAASFLRDPEGGVEEEASSLPDRAFGIAGRV